MRVPAERRPRVPGSRCRRRRLSCSSGLCGRFSGCFPDRGSSRDRRTVNPLSGQPPRHLARDAGSGAAIRGHTFRSGDFGGDAGVRWGQKTVLAPGYAPWPDGIRSRWGRQRVTRLTGRQRGEELEPRVRQRGKGHHRCSPGRGLLDEGVIGVPHPSSLRRNEALRHRAPGDIMRSSQGN